MNFRLVLAALLAPGAWCCAAVAQPPHPVDASLIAEHQALQAGDADNWVALRLLPDRGWHTYWQNPGDSGLPTKLVWSLPEGVTAGDIHWPHPHRESLGELTNYGYSDETLHLVPIRVAAGWPAGRPVELKAEARWLVCSDICIPGSAQVALALPVEAAPRPEAAWSDAFARARAALPKPTPGWRARFDVAGSDVSLALEGPELESARDVELYPLANDLVNHASPQRVAIDGPGKLRLSQHVSSYFVEAPASIEAVLVVGTGEGARAYQFMAQPGSVTPVAAAAPAAAATPAPELPTPVVEVPGLALVLVFALLGGLILNLMPCVFPILSLKALALMRSREDDRAHLRHALFYTAGVVGSCVVAAALLIGLRAAGEAVGWGFQLQSPVFVAFLCYLLFALGLSLSGAAEFGSGLMNLGQSLTAGGGDRSAFFTGVLAVVVASPCTAPFMGTALGYALTQPPAVSLLVFAALGIGLALPFLLLGLSPRLAALLPRPGAWMQTFRQAMAFPLYLTVAWLLWVLGRQTGADGPAAAMVGLVLIALALWLWPRRSALARVATLAALAGALALLSSSALEVRGFGGPAAHSGWEAWSDARVAELRAQRRTVFVDFTADWCLSCKVNERVAFASDRVKAAFRDGDVALLQADWTRADPAITRALQSFGRSGVPLYLVYANGGEPEVLPQILTPDIILDALQGEP